MDWLSYVLFIISELIALSCCIAPLKWIYRDRAARWERQTKNNSGQLTLYLRLTFFLSNLFITVVPFLLFDDRHHSELSWNICWAAFTIFNVWMLIYYMLLKARIMKALVQRTTTTASAFCITRAYKIMKPMDRIFSIVLLFMYISLNIIISIRVHSKGYQSHKKTLFNYLLGFNYDKGNKELDEFLHITAVIFFIVVYCGIVFIWFMLMILRYLAMDRIKQNSLISQEYKTPQFNHIQQNKNYKNINAAGNSNSSINNNHTTTTNGNNKQMYKSWNINDNEDDQLDSFLGNAQKSMPLPIENNGTIDTHPQLPQFPPQSQNREFSKSYTSPNYSRNRSTSQQESSLYDSGYIISKEKMLTNDAKGLLAQLTDLCRAVFALWIYFTILALCIFLWKNVQDFKWIWGKYTGFTAGILYVGIVDWMGLIFIRPLHRKRSKLRHKRQIRASVSVASKQVRLASRKNTEEEQSDQEEEEEEECTQHDPRNPNIAISIRDKRKKGSIQ